jgi:hypothetical protein
MSETTDARHERPRGVDDLTVDAMGKVSEAFDTLQRARGALYTFHQQIGWVDDTLSDGLDMLREAGHAEVADEVAQRWLGCNVLPGMWTFEVVEAFERTYYEVAVASERQLRETVMDGREHIQEAERKVRRRQDRPADDDHGR